MIKIKDIEWKDIETRTLENIRYMLLNQQVKDERLYIQRCEDNCKLLAKVSAELERRNREG
jgi:hypothetical protein